MSKAKINLLFSITYSKKPSGRLLPAKSSRLEWRRIGRTRFRCMREAKKTGLLGVSLQELTSVMEELGQPSYRAQQVFQAIYGQRVSSVEQISTLPQTFRRKLSDSRLDVGFPTLENKFQSTDG